MAACHHPALLCETIHFQVKDPMASDLLVSNWGLLVPFLDVKCHPHILHFLGDGICPKGTAILLVDGVSLIDTVRYSYAKLVGLLDHTLLLSRDDTVSFL